MTADATQSLHLQARIDTLTARNTKLLETLKEARQQLLVLREEVDRLGQPPSGYGVLLDVLPGACDGHAPTLDPMAASSRGITKSLLPPPKSRAAMAKRLAGTTAAMTTATVARTRPTEKSVGAGRSAPIAASSHPTTRTSAQKASKERSAPIARV